MSDISFENLNGIVTLLAMAALASVSVLTGIVLLIIAPRGSRWRWRSRPAVCLWYALACVSTGVAVTYMSVPVRTQADDSCIFWAPALFLGGCLLLRVR